MNELPFDRLRPIGFTATLAAAFDDAAAIDGCPARIVEVQRDTVTLHDGNTEMQARLHPRLPHRSAAADDWPVVGDWVVAGRDAFGQTWVRLLLPRTTRIVRSDDHGARQTLVANVDRALLLMGLDGDFNPRRIERYLALVQGAGVQPVIVLTKRDCAQRGPTAIDELRRRIPAIVPIEAVDATAATTAVTLAPYVDAGQTLVLLGSSGAGKSTLTNTLLGRAAQATGAVRADDSRGRHTTTARSLHLIPGGACIIDTPGLRGLRVDLDEAQLAASFSDIADLAGRCRFRDCRHGAEPGCAVRAAVAADRLRNFHKLSREAQREQMTIFDRQRQRAEWKSRGRAAAERMRMKRG